MIVELLKKLIVKKYYKEKTDIENKLNVFYAMSKISDEEYFKALDNAKGESINLMTQEELNAENNEVVDEGPLVDSVFKSDLDLMEEVTPYKASKIDLLGMEKEKAMSKEENIYEPIELKEPPKPVKEEPEVKEQHSKFTSELDPKKDIEYVDL